MIVNNSSDKISFILTKIQIDCIQDEKYRDGKIRMGSYPLAFCRFTFHIKILTQYYNR